MKIKHFLILAFGFSVNVLAQDNTWRGLKIEKEDRCSPYNRSRDYVYPPTVENQIVKSLGNRVYSPYSGKMFRSIEETDIEHIVSLSEAHDSGLCSANKETKHRFASDTRNLTLASPDVNRDEKSGHDASGWLPEKNKCWFAKRVIEIKKAYNLTVDSEELVALEKVISQCSSFKMAVLNSKDSPSHSSGQSVGSHTAGLLSGPNVKKSRSNICHWKASSPYYSMTKHYQSFHDIQTCLKAGGRCPKRDFKCQSAIVSNKDSSYKKKTVSHVQKPYFEQLDAGQGIEPNVKKSNSGICHSKSSSSHYSRTKNFTAYQSLELCLKAGGRCPKRDFKCQSAIVSNKDSSYKKKTVSHVQKPYSEQLDASQGIEPNVKKSNSGICHSKSSSSHYSRTKNFTAYQSLELCLKAGGRCPKKDFKCQSAIVSNKDSSYKKKTVSHVQKPYFEQLDAGQGIEPNVKKSNSGICHSKSSSSHYSRTKNFTAYQSLELCLKAGGRCPKTQPVAV